MNWSLVRSPNWWLLVIILVISAGLRLYRIDRPLGDWHSWRQADTASVTREFVKHGIDLLRPTYHDLSNIPSGKENPSGYRMVEFPFINALVASIISLSGTNLEVHVVSRLVNISFSLMAIVLMYLIGTQLVSPRLGLITAAVFGFLPYNLFFHTTVLPEVPMVTLSLLSFYAWIRYLASQKIHWLMLVIVSAALALLLKPIFVFYGPVFVYLAWMKWHRKLLSRWWLFVVAGITFVPLIWWRQWISSFPEGIPAATWLLNSDGIRFKGAFFQWLFGQRLGELILGYWGLIFLALGLSVKPKEKQGWSFHLLFLGMLMYLTIFATGNVTHDYYQVFIIPSVVFLVGLGIERMVFGPFFQTNLWLSRLTAVIGLGFMLAFGWYGVRGFFNVNNQAMVVAGQAVDRLTPEDSLVIAPYMGDTAFLYQTNRRGWPIGFNLNLRLDQGATHYVSTSYDDEARLIESNCQVIDKTPDYILIDLLSCDREKLD